MPTDIFDQVAAPQSDIFDEVAKAPPAQAAPKGQDPFDSVYGRKGDISVPPRMDLGMGKTSPQSAAEKELQKAEQTQYTMQPEMKRDVFDFVGDEKPTGKQQLTPYTPTARVAGHSAGPTLDQVSATEPQPSNGFNLRGERGPLPTEEQLFNDETGFGKAVGAIDKYAVQPFEAVAQKGSEVGRGVAENALHVEPFSTSPGMESMGEGTEQKPAPSVLGGARAVGSVVGSTVADPRNAPLMAGGFTSAIMRRLMGMGFSAMMAKGAIDQSRELGAILDDQSIPPEDKIEKGASAVLNTLMAADSARHSTSLEGVDARYKEALAQDIWQKGYATDNTGQKVPITGGLAQARAIANKLASQIGPQTAIGKLFGASKLEYSAKQRPAPAADELTQPPPAQPKALPAPPANAAQAEAMRSNAEATAAMGRSVIADKMAADIVAGKVPNQAPTPPTPPPFPDGHISPKFISQIAEHITSLPEEQRPQAMMEAHQKMTEALTQQGRVIGPDGQLHVIDNPKQAAKIAQTWMNAKVEEIDKQQQEAAKEPVGQPKPAEIANPKGILQKLKAAIEKATIGSQQERVIEESKKTVDKQVDALKSGNVPVVFIPAGASYVPKLPAGFSRADVDAKHPGGGIYYYDSNAVSARQIKQAAKEGTHGELMGHVQSKAELGNSPAVIVQAKDAHDGTPIQDSAVAADRPELIQHQAEILQQRHPEAEIAVRPGHEVLGERMAAHPEGESALEEIRRRGIGAPTEKPAVNRVAKGDRVSFTDRSGKENSGTVNYSGELVTRITDEAGKEHKVAPSKVKAAAPVAGEQRRLVLRTDGTQLVVKSAEKRDGKYHLEKLNGEKITLDARTVHRVSDVDVENPPSDSPATRGPEATAELAREAAPNSAKLPQAEQLENARVDVQRQVKQLRANLDELASINPDFAKEFEAREDVQKLLAQGEKQASNGGAHEPGRNENRVSESPAGISPEVREGRGGNGAESGRPEEPSAGKPAEEVTPKSTEEPALGSDLRIMGIETKLAESDTVAGVRYDLFKGDKGSVIRVTDTDSGNVVSLKKYPTYDFAEREFKKALELIDKTSEAKPYEPRMGALVTYKGKQYEVGHVGGGIVKLQDPATHERVHNFVPKSEITPLASKQDAAPQSLHGFLHDKIKAGEMPANNFALRKLVAEYDGKPATDARLKEAQEEMEVALAQRARDIIAEGKSDRETFDDLVKLYNSQPNLNVRTSTSVENQAYSTPAPLAFIASRLAGIDHSTTVYEPTAGTGMLLIGADPQNVTANELNPYRAKTLREQGYDVTEGDALKAKVEPGSIDSVIANPPFGSVKENGNPIKVKVDGYSIGKLDHLIAARALDAMKDDGKATIILGADKVTGGLTTDDRIFFNWLYSHYNVASQFEVSGNLYGRQGANWPVRIISVDGRSASSNVSPMPGDIARANTWEEVYGQFDRSLGAIQPATSDQRPSHPVQRGEEAANAPAVRADAGRPIAGTDRAEPTGSAKYPVELSGARPEPVRHSDAAPAEGLAIPDHGLRPDDDVSESTRLPEGGAKEESPPERRTRTKGTDRSAALVDPDNAFQVPYSPASSKKDVGVLIPTNMKAPLEDAMMALEDRVGDIDKFTQRELGYKSLNELHHALMGLQIDSVAAAIDQIKQGKAAIIADQTGIGKGRQAAAIIRWAVKNGKVPVFITQKPELFTDMFQDLADIGSENISPLLMNSDAWISTQGGQKLFANSPSRHGANLRNIVETGELPTGRNALFTTYSQINKANTQQGALRSLAPRAIFILDESHTAGGESATGEYIRSLLTDAAGVTYLSATYAKRPDNMPLYFKTDMGLAIGDSNTLIDAMAMGGLPLQTVVSHNLVKAGQMFRRERSFKGVDIATKIDVEHGQQHVELADETTQALRAIVEADHEFHNGYVVRTKKEFEKSGQAMAGGGNKAEQGLSHGEFTSVVHNFVKQMLLSLKSDTAAEEAISALKRGEKPIIGVENTMGSFLNHYVADHGIRDGQPLTDFDYRTVLSRALDRTRHIIITNQMGDKIKKYIPLSELDPESRAVYEKAQKVIDGLDLPIPVSPIDWIRNKIEKAGYSVSEITGRNLAIDYTDEKVPRLSSVPLREQNDKVDTTRRFNGGKLDVIVANVAGATGISLHASEKFPDQRMRHMIVVQPAADINTFMQMLGRIHRTGQVKLPRYTILNADLPAEKRPTALLSKKMKSLNANTSSNTESATSIKAPDMLNKYGDEIVGNYLNDNPELESMLDVSGLGDGDKPIEDIARKATGRLAILPVKTQEQFYNDVEHSYNDYIKYLNDTNQNDLEPRTFDYDARETRSQVLVEGEHPASPFGQDAIYGEYSIKAQSKPLTTEEVTSAIRENLGGKTGSEHASELIGSLEDGLKKYIATLSSESVSAQTAERVAAVAKSVISFHPIGTTLRIEINGNPYSAAITNVTSAHKGTGNPFSLSKIKFTLATTGPLRSLHVPATQLSRIEIRPLYDSPESVFNSWRRSDARETAKIVTGNLLAAYGELTDSKGTIINFTKADGTVEQGILLPKKFEIEHNTRGDFRMRSPEHALNFLKKSIHPDIESIGIASRDGNVRIIRRAGELVISTPKSKARGGKYFLDHKITNLVGDFTSHGNFMQASVPANKAKQAINAVMDKTALYALPSMADEARMALGKKDKATDAQEEAARVVPGARSAFTGNETNATSIQDLTESIARQTPAKSSWKARVMKGEEIGAVGKDTVSKMLGKVQGGFAALLDAYKRPPRWQDYEDATGKWSGADQVNALDLYRFTKAIKEAVPSKLKREAISNWIEAGGDIETLQDRAELSEAPYKAGYEAALDLTDAEQTIARNIMNRNDATLEEAKEAGILKEGVENYVRHVYADDPKAQARYAAEMNFNSLQTKPGFTKQRTIPTYFDAEQLGFTPKDKDVGYLTAIHERAFREAIAARAYIRSLMDGRAADGRPLVVTNPASAHEVEGDEERGSAYLVKMNTGPDEKYGDYQVIDHPALRGWRWIANIDGKDVLAQGDALVHPDHYRHLKNNLTKSALRSYEVKIGDTTIKPGELALDAQANLKHLILSFSGFHQTTLAVHALEHRSKPGMLPELDLNDEKQMALVNHGLMVANYDAEEAFSEGVASGGVTKYVPVIGPLYHQYVDYLFKSYLPRVKMEMALNALERNQERYTGKLSQDEIHAITAKQANAAFGGLNYRLLGRNKTFQDVLRLTLMAPDFLEARSRFVGQAARPGGAEQLHALLLGALVLYTAARLLNEWTDKQAHWDLPFSVVLHGKEYHLRTVQEDLWNAIKEPGKFAKNRLSPLAGAALAGMSDSKYKVTPAQRFKNAASSAVPIPAQPWMRKSHDSAAEKTAESILKVAGINVKKAAAK